MLTIEDLADEEFLHRADSDDWKITNCTCLHYTRRDPENRSHVQACALGADRPARA